MKIHRRNQRGVVLLVVVSMLVLFVLIGVTYAIVSSQYRRGARIVSRQKQLGVDPEQHLDSALYQVLRDTNSSASAIRGHSLLRDLYGGSVGGKVNADPSLGDNGNFLVIPTNLQNNQANSFAGCVLTFTNGLLKGTSTRVIHSNKNVLTLMRPKDIRLPRSGTRFVVNGRPFSGFGAGYDPNNLDPDNPDPYRKAKLPNLRGDSARANSYLATGAHENYDAVDYQNMAMAAVIPTAGGNVRVIPSFHRPALIRYQQATGSWNAALQRQVILRPMNRVYGSDPPAPGEHPEFTGGNPAFDPLDLETWDVDNDNDGTPDSVWVDLGMPVQTDASGRQYKPLFAVLCVDMDGKFNLNAHGSLAVLNKTPQQQEVLLAGNVPSRHLPPGQAFGPAEISFRGLFGNQQDYLAMLSERYGPGYFPGQSRGIDPLLQVKLFQYSHAPEIFRGNLALGIDHFGQPIFENTGQPTDIPYETNLSQLHQRGKSPIPTVTDTAYSVAEMERVLRAYDADQKALPHTQTSNRLHRLLDPVTRKPVGNNNHLITTDSYDLPVANGTALAAIRKILHDRKTLLPHELEMGLRWNINQPFGELPQDNLQVTKSPTTKRRQEYANYLYVLMTAAVRYDTKTGRLKDMPALWDTNGDNTPTVAETTERIAQWAVNAVDFRDPDSIMTLFPYDPNPFDDNANTRFVWGCERPELLITETLAFHDRRTEDLDTDPSKKKTTADEDEDTDFDQRFRPRGSLFVELYNPWTGSSNKPQDLCLNTGGVILNATTKMINPKSNSKFDDPTWRMLIVKGDLGRQDPANVPKAIERSIYFTNKGLRKEIENGERRFYQPSFANLGSLPPGRYAVTGSLGQLTPEKTYITPIGRHVEATEDDASTLLYGKTRHIQMLPTFAVNNNTKPGAPDKSPADMQSVLSIPIKWLSISEPPTPTPYPVPEATIAGEPAYDPVRDLPVDTNPELLRNGTKQSYRVVYLQRLANPQQEWNPQTNPYRTIDSMPVNLTVFNGLTTDAEDEMDPNREKAEGEFRAEVFSTRERGKKPVRTDPKNRNLWKQEDLARNSRSFLGVDPLHLFRDNKFPNTLGFLNSSYGPEVSRADAKKTGAPVGAPAFNGFNLTFPTLTWNNRSFQSVHELMLVPFSNQLRLATEFSPAVGTKGIYTPGDPGKFGHLPNFFDPSTGLYRIFDFLQTPSPFVRTETILHPERFQQSNKSKLDGSDPRLYPPFDQISDFRDPGKINLNTIFDKRVWDGLWNLDLNNELQVFDSTGKPINRTLTPNPELWGPFLVSRRGYGRDVAQNPPNPGLVDILAIDPTKTSYFSNPFRAVSSPVVDTIESTIMRSNGQGEQLFYYPPVNNYTRHQERQAGFRYQPLQRVSNLTTTRSNVYAIWITVGYFEVKDVGNSDPLIYPDGYQLGLELGWDRGAIRRHRAFYMVDRSIPVAFEPGENHNVDRSIMLRRYIE